MNKFRLKEDSYLVTVMKGGLWWFVLHFAPEGRKLQAQES